MEFHKYHALGNDYLVLDPATAVLGLTPAVIRLLCHRHFGIGSDGILRGPEACVPADFPAADPAGTKSTDSSYGLRIFNPDGSEAEKSGNGLRIFARYLWDTGRATGEPFTVLTLGGPARCRVLADGRLVTVEMGRVSFRSRDIPVSGPERDVVAERMEFGGRVFNCCAATVGNPHCVILRDEISAAETTESGPLIETDARFPNRTNVQFMKVLDRSNIRIEIWERGAGYTLASGSSASAAAAAARRLGLCDASITVHMPGGSLDIEVTADYGITLTGPVTPVAHGAIAPEALEQAIP